MLLSTMALVDLRIRCISAREIWRGWLSPAHRRRIVSAGIGGLPRLPQLEVGSNAGSGATHPRQEVEPETGGQRWRRHPQLRESPPSLLPDAQRRARRFAVQGLYAAHAGRADEAYLFFVQAVFEDEIDLSLLPSFWQMPRGALTAAAEAYERVGRLRDAAALHARIRTELRPRNVVPIRPSPALGDHRTRRVAD